MPRLAFLSLSFLLISTVLGKDSEEKDSDPSVVQAAHYANCPAHYLAYARNMSAEDYDRLSIDFSDVKLSINSRDAKDPHRLKIPGCLQAKIENVKFGAQKLRDLVAEFSLRAGKTPVGDWGLRLSYSGLQGDPGRIPCANDTGACPCGDAGNACLRCGFCRSLRGGAAGTLHFDLTRPAAKSQLLRGRSCQCDKDIQPQSAYTIQTEICTPGKEALAPSGGGNEMLEALGAGEELRVWATIFLYSAPASPSESLLAQTAWGEERAIQMRNARTAGCFLISFNAHVPRE